jgi:hypothetical protein
VQNLQGKQRRPKHSDDLLCLDPNRGVLLLSKHERGCSLSLDQPAQAQHPCNEVVPPSPLLSISLALTLQMLELI